MLVQVQVGIYLVYLQLLYVHTYPMTGLSVMIWWPIRSPIRQHWTPALLLAELLHSHPQCAT